MNRLDDLFKLSNLIHLLAVYLSKIQHALNQWFIAEKYIL